MMFDIDAESMMMGFMFGVAAGAQGFYWFAQWIRCENCCWTDRPKPEDGSSVKETK